MGHLSDKIAGRSKETTGKVTGDKKLEMKGKSQAELADMKEKTKNTMHKIDHKLDNR